MSPIAECEMAEPSRNPTTLRRGVIYESAEMGSPATPKQRCERFRRVRPQSHDDFVHRMSPSRTKYR